MLSTVLKIMENSYGYFVILFPEDKGRACYATRFSQTSRYTYNLSENFEQTYFAVFLTRHRTLLQ